MCPTSHGSLVRAVTEAVSPLSGGLPDKDRAQIEAVVESVVACGDLLELPIDEAGVRRRALFLGPPAFVRCGTGYLLLGVRPEGAPIVSDQLAGEVEHRGHSRLIRSQDPAVRDFLASEGLIELQAEHWLHAPRVSSPRKLADYYFERLSAAGKASGIEGLRILDPLSDVRFYRGRWRELEKRDEGRFVARRPQAFGAALWCCTEIVGGEVAGLIDLPIQSPLARGCDEAWRLQAALDLLSERPQHVRVQRMPVTPEVAVLDLFSPLPSWAQRRLDVIATPVTHSRGALFSYQLLADDIEEEVRFLKAMMWFVVEEGDSTDARER